MAPFEILDSQLTPLGNLVLRRRNSPSAPEAPVYEVTLNSEMLMSSSVNVSERALARLALEGRQDRPLDVIVGGLGLGYTASAALDFENVRSVKVVELLDAVIGWHNARLVPLADKLMDDPRCTLIAADFFEYVRDEANEGLYDAILLDIDHAPDCLLDARHGMFYDNAGLKKMAASLRPQGIFALWSAWEPEDDFMAELDSVFRSVQSHEISFLNPHMNEDVSNWVIICGDAVQ